MEPIRHGLRMELRLRPRARPNPAAWHENLGITAPHLPPPLHHSVRSRACQPARPPNLPARAVASLPCFAPLFETAFAPLFSNPSACRGRICSRPRRRGRDGCGDGTLMAGAPTNVGSPIQRHTNQASASRHAFTARCHSSSCHSRVPASFTTFDERRSARSSAKIAKEDRGGER